MSEVRIVARACVILTYSTGWRERAARKTKKERNREFGGVKKVWLGFKRGLGSGIVQALEVLQVLNTPNIGQHRALPPEVMSSCLRESSQPVCSSRMINTTALRRGRDASSMSAQSVLNPEEEGQRRCTSDLLVSSWWRFWTGTCI